jgi:hypothetical protein
MDFFLCNPQIGYWLLTNYSAITPQQTELQLLLSPVAHPLALNEINCAAVAMLNAKVPFLVASKVKK